MLGDSSNPYTIYDFSETEHSMYPEKVLKGFKGVLLSDGTNKFNGIIAAGATSANCWAHLHCRFEEAWLDDKIT
ncbi:MAG: transposase [Candidatus Obscuribacter phosphatis]|uniref:Transposase n=1 Tax=Candidatus Obscuribacter phosphatis TaxID=1906157 RepID=A0A8J7PFH8_9BACT|nr:transposase [Candidatus Obscuribacter phosphatis]